MARFTEPRKWDDVWFRKLGPLQKLVIFFLWDRCDQAGFWEIDIDGMAFHTGVSSDKIRPLFEGLNNSQEGLQKALIKRGNFVWIKDFIGDQKNLPLNPMNNAHTKIISCIRDREDFEEADLLLPDVAGEQRARVSRKEAVWVRDRGVCQYCNIEVEELGNYELDHIHPRAAGVSEIYTNFACSCLPCNREKSDSPVDLKVSDYSAAQAKKELRSDPSLLVKFNSFFGRNLKITNGSMTEIAPQHGAQLSPIGKVEVEVRKEKKESAERKQKVSIPDHPQALELNSLFGRLETTKWNDKEIKAFETAVESGAMTPENVSRIRSYYTIERAKPDGVHRRDLSTLLNNWSGELDRCNGTAKPSNNLDGYTIHT